MNRPEIAQFFPADTTPADIQKAFTACPELYKYIVALDAYVDELEGEKSEETESDSKCDFLGHLDGSVTCLNCDLDCKRIVDIECKFKKHGQ